MNSALLRSVVVFSSLIALEAWAQTPNGSDEALGVEPKVEAQEMTPRAEGDADASAAADEAAPVGAAGRVARLLSELRSEEESVWRKAESDIVATWSKSGSASMDLLLTRGKSAMEAQKFDQAVDHLTDLVNLEPSFAEAWNTRAAAFYRQEKFGRALADIARALEHEPRHFNALGGLGMVFEQLGEKALAMTAFREALKIHPNMSVAVEGEKRLRVDVDGLDI